MTDESSIPPGARVALISPHLDDGVLGCGDLIAEHPGTTVVTVFAGRPATYGDVTSWDARAGFGPGDDVVAARRREDRVALASLGARPHWLESPDTQYGETPSIDAVTEALRQALDEIEPGVVVVPLGLFHSDHLLTSDAAIQAVRGRPNVACLVYADAIYRPVANLLDERLRQLRAAGMILEPASPSSAGASDRKRSAIGCYASQVLALDLSWDGGHSDAYEPEQYWRLTVPAVTNPAERPTSLSRGR